ncbi:MAG TPA: patatin-like phospholipase family protein [Candidatus Dormibacteraeota bacterium]|nr:patatin-like phospholipase family protein [Candidatus Dormibacteraeota bacterium]
MIGAADTPRAGSRRLEEVVERLVPRWARPPRLAVVLGGGASLGAFEVGVLDVLARRGLVPDLLVGTSIGAINAAFWAFHPTPEMADRLLQLWLACDRSTMIPDGPVPIFGRLVQRKRYLTTQSGVARAVSRGLPAEAAIEDAAIPLAIVAADADRGTKVVLRSGPVLPAVMASTAIPVLFPPASVGGRRLVDGGVVANCDVETAVEAGMTDVLVVDVLGDGPVNGDSRLWDVAANTVGVMLRRQTELAVRACGRSARVALLRPRFAVRPGPSDFDMTAQLYRWGQEAASAFVAARLRGRRRLRSGLFEYETGRDHAAPAVA